MPGAKTAFLAGLLTAACLGGAAWLLRVVPEREDAAQRLREAEEAARRAGREARDAKQWAESEQDRRRFFEERVKELERAAASAAPPGEAPPGSASHGHGATAPMAPGGPPPEEWDRQRLNQEITNLASNPATVANHPRLPLVMRALRAMGDPGRDLVLQILRARIDAAHTAVASIFAEGLGETRAVPLIAESWRAETEPTPRHVMLRALANIPGDTAVPILREAWLDPGSDAQTRKFAIQGLALRGDAIARAVAAGEETAPGAQRVRAIEFLRAYAEKAGWNDPSLVAVFGRSLRTADGPAQRKLSLIALEGFWSKDSLADLDAFAADAASPPELVTRAKHVADSIRAGAARPEGAGIPERSLVPEDAGAPEPRPGDRTPAHEMPPPR